MKLFKGRLYLKLKQNESIKLTIFMCEFNEIDTFRSDIDAVTTREISQRNEFVSIHARCHIDTSVSNDPKHTQ